MRYGMCHEDNRTLKTQHIRLLVLLVLALVLLPSTPPLPCSGEQVPLPTSRRVWTAEEDEAIRRLVDKHGTSNWTFIADSLALSCNSPGRSGKQCWERWHNHLGETNPVQCGDKA